MFNTKSQNYNQYRLTYPKRLTFYLKKNNILKKDDVIAEFGCGTGKLTDMLLKNGNIVYGVEPNSEMFKFLEKKFSEVNNCFLTKNKAESSFLPDNKFDLILAAQSFHLFDALDAKREFYRILKPSGIVVLIWYSWNMNYEISSKIRNLFYDYGKKQKQPNRLDIGFNMLSDLFSPNIIIHNTVDTIQQRFSKSDFLCSMLSSSYAPSISHATYNDYKKKINEIFHYYSKGGCVEYSFTIEVYHSKLMNL